jgi:hypothetical protein
MLLATRESDPRQNFRAMPYEEQLAAIGRLLSSGHTEYTVAAATGWSVEAIRRAIGGRKEARA